MELIGKATINPFLFYTGKFSGYYTWIVFILLIMKINIVDKHSFIICEKLSLLFFIIALIFIIYSFLNLGKSVRLGLPKENTNLKINGIFRISRNPMYLGFNLLTISSILYSLNIVTLILGIYCIIIYHFIILGEEQFLLKRFGLEFINYKKRTRRYI